MLTEEGLISVPGMLSRWVRLGTGVKAHYMTAGETGPAVVLLHGGIIGSSGVAGWRFMAPFLGAHGFRVYCPDIPGYGLTDDPEGIYGPSLARFPDYVHDFTTAVGLDRFHLGGNSMGCATAVNYVVAHPERVISVALIAGVVGDLVPLDELLRLDTRPESQRPNIRQFDGTPESMRRMMEAIISRPEAINEDLLAMRTAHANRQREAYARRMANDKADNQDPNVRAKLSTRGRLDRLTIPMIYLYGRDDVVFPIEMAYPQEDALERVQFFYPADCGHQGQTDQPEIVNQLFLEFFGDGKISWETAQRAGISPRRAPNAELVETPVGESSDVDGGERREFVSP